MADITLLQEKAADLGRLIGQSAEYQAVKRAGEALNADREAVALLQQMERLQTDAQRMIQRGEQPGEEMERQLDELLGKIQGNSLYQRMAASEENFNKLMQRVNEWIGEGIRKGATSSIITLG
ncbi:MAG: YlbF family regulator [Gemmatimonadaceae bacterium]